MDDEELVREATVASFEELGYVAETAEDGEAAVALYRQTLGTDASFDLVVLDLTVPGGMGGEATLRALRAVDPKVKVIVASGYGNDPVLTRYEEHGFSGAIAKPFRLSDVECLLERLIGVTTRD